MILLISTLLYAICGNCAQTRDEKIFDNIVESCNKTAETDYLFTFCSPYLNSKKVAQNQGDKIVGGIKKVVPKEALSVSSFLVKTAYEQRISFKIHTNFGDSDFSINREKTMFNWTYPLDF